MIHKVIVPDSSSINVTLDIPKDYIGKEIEIIAFIKKDGLKTKPLSPTLKGPKLTIDEFQDWIKAAEDSPTMSLDEAKQKWEVKKQAILNRMKLG